MYYVENGSKNRSGSYKDKPDDNKVTKHYGISTLGDRCYYHVLKFYFEKLSPTVLSAVFYWKPKDTFFYSSLVYNSACWKKGFGICC